MENQDVKTLELDEETKKFVLDFAKSLEASPAKVLKRMVIIGHTVLESIRDAFVKLDPGDNLDIIDRLDLAIVLDAKSPNPKLIEILPIKTDRRH